MTRQYREILAQQQTILWGDRYARTMAQALFSEGLHNTPVTFNAYIRKAPFGGSYLVSAGQGIVREWLDKKWLFDEDTLDFLREETAVNPKTGQQERLFTEDFLDMIQSSTMDLQIEALPEGALAFPDEPIYRVTGPAWQALWIETAITNALNSQSLFATLATRMVAAANGQPVTEYGLRRGHSIGGLPESRAAWIGGISGTSNDQAAFYYQIPASGTMAHAFVMFFDTEVEAFKSYLTAMPHNAVLLIDTFDTLQGVRNAVKAAQETDTPLKGVRLDSGDLAGLSVEVRQILDGAGFTETKIIASNNLDEYKIEAMKADGKNAIEIWAVGTRLTTTDRDNAMQSEASLGAVYKLANVNGDKDRLKLSETEEKSTIPGDLSVMRHYTDDGLLIGSTILPARAENTLDARTGCLLRDVVSINKNNPTEQIVYAKGSRAEVPLRPLMAFAETIHTARDRAKQELSGLPEVYRQLASAPRFPVGIEEGLFQHRQEMIMMRRPPVRECLALRA